MKKKLFTLFWKSRLKGRRVVVVLGWRTALVEDPLTKRVKRVCFRVNWIDNF